jgi:hypothetical protein
MTDDNEEPPPGAHGVYARLNPSPQKVAEAVADYKAR